MSIWLRRGGDFLRLNGIGIFGRPPVLAPPAWALERRVQESAGAADDPAPLIPEDWAEGAAAALPNQARRVVVVIPDATRTGPWKRLLAPLIAALDRRLEPGARRTVLIAGGIHAPEAVDVPGLSGAGWALVQNGERQFRDHRSVGTTAAGTEVALLPEYLDADWRILVSETSYHYFAGFGGGPKLVFPGLAAPEGILANHRRALVGASRHAAARPGILVGNPVHEDLGDAVALAPPHWSIFTTEGTLGLEVVQGPALKVFPQVVRRHDARHRVPFTSAPRLLVVDAGGDPRDTTFLQAHKSLQHGAEFLRDGARLLVVAACRAGYGSATLEQMARNPSLPLEPGGAHAQTRVALLETTRRVVVGLWSDLPPDEVRNLGLTPLASLAEARAFCAAAGSEPAWGWLPRAERFLPAEGWLGGGKAR